MTVTVNQTLTPSFTQLAAICSGGSFTLPTTSNNGITGTWSPAINTAATTTYTFTPTTGQCASSETMTVTVIQVNTQVIQDSIIIQAVQPNAQYQWLDCQNAYSAIFGEISQVFTAQINGNYAVEITFMGCADTSECNVINTLAMDELNKKETVRIFPNPGTGLYVLDGLQQEETINVYNGVGQVILTFKTKSTQEAIDLIDFAPGLYVVEGETFRIKIIQQ